ncbi:MAG: hypothetical protein ACREAF_03895 [Nitrosopumilaceae archaeon]
MSQILVQKQRRNEHLLFQDLYFARKPAVVKTSVMEAVCDICKKGLEDGLSVTATTIKNKTKLFCEMHLPK